VTALRPAEELPASIKPSIFTLIDPQTREFETTVGGKRELLAFAPPTRRLMLVWTGQYRSDVFEITVAQARDRMI
jgi:hypothetical protein